MGYMLQRRPAPPPHKRRQQPRRRHRTLRPGPGLPDALDGHHRQRGGVRAVCGVRDYFAVGASVVEDGVAGAHGRDGGCAEGVNCMIFFQSPFLYLKGDKGVLCDVGELGCWDDVCQGWI